jgi:hypothetical protein
MKEKTEKRHQQEEEKTTDLMKWQEEDIEKDKITTHVMEGREGKRCEKRRKDKTILGWKEEKEREADRKKDDKQPS